MITRTIVPIINQPTLGAGTEHAFGMGDINPSVFLSPAVSQGFVWGVGVTTTLPTTSDSELGSGAWSHGPAAVGLCMNGPWVVGALVNQQWSLAGWSGRDVNLPSAQTLLNYNLPDGWYLASTPIITADFSASHGNRFMTTCATSLRALLADPHLKIDTVARTIGFNETASFSKAFQRWQGCSASQYRACQARPAAIAPPSSNLRGRADRRRQTTT